MWECSRASRSWALATSGLGPATMPACRGMEWRGRSGVRQVGRKDGGCYRGARGPREPDVENASLGFATAPAPAQGQQPSHLPLTCNAVTALSLGFFHTPADLVLPHQPGGPAPKRQPHGRQLRSAADAAPAAASLLLPAPHRCEPQPMAALRPCCSVAAQHRAKGGDGAQERPSCTVSLKEGAEALNACTCPSCRLAWSLGRGWLACSSSAAAQWAGREGQGHSGPALVWHPPRLPSCRPAWS